jgi:hypothetical protein
MLFDKVSGICGLLGGMLTLFMSSSCASQAFNEQNYIEAFEKKAKLKANEAFELAKAKSKKDGREGWVRNQYYIIDGCYFFPREVSKLNHVKDWGYQVNPDSGLASYRDSNKAHIIKNDNTVKPVKVKEVNP